MARPCKRLSGAQEGIKLIASLGLFFFEVPPCVSPPLNHPGGILALPVRGRSLARVRWASEGHWCAPCRVVLTAVAAKLAVPAGLYFLQNSALQIASANLPAAVFQVLYQGKTLVVAICSVLLLRKVLTRAKWLALLVMALGLAAVQVRALLGATDRWWRLQLGSGVESAQKHMGNDKEQSIELGLAVVLVGCLCSGFAGVYFESMMKPIPDKDGTLPKNPSMCVHNHSLS